MPFVETEDGLINYDCIVKVSTRQDQVTIHYRYGKDIHTTKSVRGDNNDILRLSAPVFSSPPGYFAIQLCEDGYIWKSPVVGWALYAWGASPICPDDHENDVDVLTPDGSVIVAADRTYGSIEEWKTFRLKNE